MSISRLFEKKFLLIIICLFFLFTRLYKISEIPVSLYWDEASIGYNAYSILKTGQDEWGNFLPLHFRAFGEFKLPVYIYSVIPSIIIFGLNELSVRLPAVIFSLGVVILTYLVAKEFTGNQIVGILSSFLVTISPWFFIFSRTGYEATAGLMFFLLGIYLFLKSEKSPWYVFWSILSFILSAYSYNSFRVLTLPVILVLVIFQFIIFRKQLGKFFLPIILSAILLVLSIIPIYRLYVFDAGSSRLQVIGTTKGAFFKNYLSNFSFDFLFLYGDKNLRSQQGNFGQLYLIDLLLLPLGLIYLVTSKSKYHFLPIIFLLLGPIPAAITKEAPHALRAISCVPFFCIISAMGIVFLKKICSRGYLVEIICGSIFLVFFFNYFFSFLTVYPTKSSQDWQYGYKQIFANYQDEFNRYNQILISDEYAQPYIFALFYQKYDPIKFRQTVIRNPVANWGFSTVSSFDKFRFGKVNQLLETESGSSLIFASQKEVIPTLSPTATINFLNREVALWVYQ